MSECIGIVMCLTSEVSWFTKGELYWLIKNDINEVCVVDRQGDYFGLTDGLTSYREPYRYTFAFSRYVL